MTLTGNSHAEQVTATRATANIFSLYRIAPMLGQTLVADESQASGPENEVVLTHAFWLTHFGGRSEAIGQPLTLVSASAPSSPSKSSVFLEPSSGCRTARVRDSSRSSQRGDAHQPADCLPACQARRGD